MYKFVLDKLQKFNKAVDDTKKASVTVAKMHTVKHLYDLAIVFQDAINNPAMYGSNSFSDYTLANNKRIFSNYVAMLQETIKNINSAETIEDLESLCNAFTETGGVQMIGWLSMNKSSLPYIDIYSYQYQMPYNAHSNFDVSNMPDDLLDPLFKDIGEKISSRRQILFSYLTNPDIPENLSSNSILLDSLLKYSLRAQDIINNNSNTYKLSTYEYFSSPSLYDIAKNYPIESYGKLIGGERGTVKISDKFNLGFMYNMYYDQFYNCSDDIFKNFKISFLRMHTQIAVNGLDIVIIPKVFLTHAVVRFLSGYMSEIQILQNENVYKSTGLVAIIGYKRKYNEIKLDEIINLFSQIISVPDDYPSLEIRTLYPEHITFRGSYAEKSDVIKELQKSFIYLAKNASPVRKAIGFDKAEAEQTPLLKFSSGQLGLILVSGRINGIIDEKNGCYHVIKGTIEKVVESNVEYDADRNEITTTTKSNRTSVCMLTADGQFKKLQ